MLLAVAIPILVAKCLTCHNPEAKTAGLDLSSREPALKVMAPGDPAASRLYQYVRDKKMPPGKPLDDTEVAAIAEWIKSGADYGGQKLSATARPKAGLDWWSLQSPVKHAVPKVPGGEHPIDAFLLVKLREKGLDFSPEADSRTLIRRLHFALTGLPPSPDDTARGYADTVERLLSSPQYGERWGRYWLDIARFAETDGGEHNNERFTAWKYRQYVIDAFNSDKPYTDFVREQVAGDALNPHDPKKVAATGFLVAGPWDSVTKRINRDELMRKTIRQDELDDMVTATFNTFQGMTVGCARCHDHKFDPIPTRDYYRLTAVFRGVTYGERDVFTDEQKKSYDTLAAPIRKRLAAASSALSKLEAPVRTRLLEAKIRAADAAKTGKRIPVNPIFNRDVFPAVTASHFRFAITAQGGKTAPVFDRVELLPAGHAVENWKAPEAATDDKPVYFEIRTPNPVNVSEVRWSSDRTTGARDAMARVYRFEYSEDGAAWKQLAASLDHDVPAEFAMPEVPEDELAAAMTADQRARRTALVAERSAIQKELDSIPALETIHAAKPEPEMTPAFLLERGSLAKPGEEVFPGALSSVKQLAPDLGKGADTERRLALAAWLTDRKNPLTARVIVNRVWQYHFGAGIVNTPSDFGFNGDRPSHPELLDYLANEFMDRGWSIKWLQRFIVSSRAYKQSAAMNEKAHAIDASNRLLWRMPLRRMDAEALRDSILAVAGTLNSERGGPSYLLQKKETKGSYLHKALDNDGPAVWRRAVYRFVVRGGERLFMDSFDCPDPAVFTPQRSVSNTPVQALTLLNNPFLLKQAEMLATRVEREAGADQDARVRRAYRLIYQRDPNERELSIARRFLDGNSFALYARGLFNSNEFVYVP